MEERWLRGYSSLRTLMMVRQARWKEKQANLELANSGRRTPVSNVRLPQYW